MAVALAPALRAQSVSPLSFDATFGLSAGSGGSRSYTRSGDVAGEATLAFRPPTGRTSGWVLGATFGRRSSGIDNGDLLCVSGCTVPFPSVSHVGILTGAEWRPPDLTLRLFGGPAFYVGGGGSGLGTQLSLDVASGFEHLELVGAVRESWIPHLNTDKFFFRSLEFGLRLQ